MDPTNQSNQGSNAKFTETQGVIVKLYANRAHDCLVWTNLAFLHSNTDLRVLRIVLNVFRDISTWK
jgi:hypothetical protein